MLPQNIIECLLNIRRIGNTGSQTRAETRIYITIQKFKILSIAVLQLGIYCSQLLDLNTSIAVTNGSDILSHICRNCFLVVERLDTSVQSLNV